MSKPKSLNNANLPDRALAQSKVLEFICCWGFFKFFSRKWGKDGNRKLENEKTCYQINHRIIQVGKDLEGH